MIQHRPKWIRKFWIGFFCLWAILLSGLLSPMVNAPGVKQWASVKWTLREREQEIQKVEDRAKMMKELASLLESNPSAQEREIRKVLGFLGESELVFEFR